MAFIWKVEECIGEESVANPIFQCQWNGNRCNEGARSISASAVCSHSCHDKYQVKNASFKKAVFHELSERISEVHICEVNINGEISLLCRIMLMSKTGDETLYETTKTNFKEGDIVGCQKGQELRRRLEAHGQLNIRFVIHYVIFISVTLKFVQFYFVHPYKMFHFPSSDRSFPHHVPPNPQNSHTTAIGEYSKSPPKNKNRTNFLIVALHISMVSSACLHSSRLFYQYFLTTRI